MSDVRSEATALERWLFDAALPLWWEVARHRWDLVVDIRGSGLSFLVRTKRRAGLRRRPGPTIEELADRARIFPQPLAEQREIGTDHAVRFPRFAGR